MRIASLTVVPSPALAPAARRAIAPRKAAIAPAASACSAAPSTSQPEQPAVAAASTRLASLVARFAAARAGQPQPVPAMERLGRLDR